jgi:CRP/FNR family cyclic AMP-dependent transcriptional regulator
VTRTIPMPSKGDLPDGPRRDFVTELRRYYRAAGRPALRKVSRAIEGRADLREITASVETVRRMVTGIVLPADQDRVYAVFRVLCEMADIDPDAPRWGDSDVPSYTNWQHLQRLWDTALEGEEGTGHTGALASSPNAQADPAALLPPPAEKASPSPSRPPDRAATAADAPAARDVDEPLRKVLDQTGDRQRPEPDPPDRISLGMRKRRWPSASLLGSIDEATRDRLLDRGTVREYPADRHLITQGDSSASVIVLLDGVAKEVGISSAGTEALLAIRVAGDLVGEFAALDNLPEPYTVTACSPIIGCLISQPDFLAVLSEDKALAQAVNRSVIAKVRAGSKRRMETAFDAPTRFARIIRELAVTYGERSGSKITIGWPVTQSELASLASVAEPTAQKALRRLRDIGVISTGYRSLTILDFQELDRIAGA